MTAITAPTPNIYLTRGPAQVAQEKYSNQTSNERYGYVTMVAYIALAVVANIFLSPFLTVATDWLLFNLGVVAVATNVVLPFVMEWFAQAGKLKAQGDKETQISRNLDVLRGGRAPHALRKEFRDRRISDRGILVNREFNHLPDAPELALLARVMYREKQAEGLDADKVRLIGEGKHREALEAGLAADKARVKAGYFAMLIEHPEIQGKFKDSFSWVNMPTEERAMRAECHDETASHLVQTRKVGADAHPAMMKREGVRGSISSGEVATSLHEMLTAATIPRPGA